MRRFRLVSQGGFGLFTNVKSPQDIFYNPQRLLVPLFQRPYVWNKERQWEPLWQDVKRVAERLLAGFETNHFLGAVVLQQLPNELGSLSSRSVIDGQQRLTTLQLLFDAIHGELDSRNLTAFANQVKALVENPEAYRTSAEDVYKVWPTNRDRPGFNEVMSANYPVSYSSLKNQDSQIAKAHFFFSGVVAAWLDEGDQENRGKALVDTISRHLQLVVIDLQADEDAQEIFETLNARGTPLTAADLIKNFVFQRLDGTPQEIEQAYHKYWALFETPFWEADVTTGRLTYPRSSLFLSQWLVAQTGQELTAREVFNRFKHYVEDLKQPVEEILPRLHADALNYQKLVKASLVPNGELDTLTLFLYRISTLESQVFTSLVIWLQESNVEPIAEQEIELAIKSLESWVVRRAILKLPTKNYNVIMVELLNQLRKTDRNQVGQFTQKFLANQSSVYSYWPTSDEITKELSTRPTYRRLGRARLRMILEALEDRRRGFGGPSNGRFADSTVSRGVNSIEHIMPQEWRTNWKFPDDDEEDATERDTRVHQIGNLTLVTKAFNSKLSNDGWEKKKSAFQEHSTLLSTADVVNSGDNWDDLAIETRSMGLAKLITEIWRVPAHNVGLKEDSISSSGTRVKISDLVQAGFIRPGQVLYARTQAHLGAQAIVSEDGAIYFEDKRYDTPSAAAKAVTNAQSVAGWWFWLVDMESGESLYNVRDAYRSTLEEEGEFEEDD
jgi:hypothetical protein